MHTYSHLYIYTPAKQNFQTVHTYCFNPKSISMGELYGNYNLLTNEWTDGLGRSAVLAAFWLEAFEPEKGRYAPQI